jgi:hypothetical protein
MKSEGKSEVLMLTRERLYLYDGGAVLTLDLPASVVKDLDVKDRDGLFNLVVTFIQNNKLVPAQLFFILAESVCFTKDFTVTISTDPAVAEAMVREYTDMIPFNNVVSKVYKTPTVWRAVGVNEDLVNIIFEAFASKGFGLSALVPANVFPDLAMSVDLTAVKAQAVLDKKAIAVRSSMVGERSANERDLVTTTAAVPKNKILPYLIGVFAIMIITLIVMIARM